jgi:hypothetical protein
MQCLSCRIENGLRRNAFPPASSAFAKSLGLAYWLVYQDWQPQPSQRAANVFAKLVAGPGGKLDMHTNDMRLTRCQVADGGIVVPRRPDGR